MQENKEAKQTPEKKLVAAAGLPLKIII